MKKFILILSVLLFSSLVKAGDVLDIGTKSYVSISTTSWTKVPTTSSLSDRSGILVNNISTNTASFVGTLVRGGLDSSDVTTIYEIEIEPGENKLYELNNGIDLYLRSLASSAENAFVLEIKQ